MQIEARKQEAEESLINLRLAGKYQLKKEEVAAWLTSFCKGDLFDMEFRKRIIDVFINAIYLYDDKVVIYFNVRGGKQVSYMEMIDDTTDFFDNITESSNFAHSGPPKRNDSFRKEIVISFYTLLFSLKIVISSEKIKEKR